MNIFLWLEDTVRKYTCPVVTGAVLVPLVIVTGGGGLAVAYTVGNVALGADVGALCHKANLNVTDYRDIVNVVVDNGYRNYENNQPVNDVIRRQKFI